ncbi:MAG TPA: hypothetical protein V6C81_29730 [Planktothrix sp.]|jgi:hypothetical protein
MSFRAHKRTSFWIAKSVLFCVAVSLSSSASADAGKKKVAVWKIEQISHVYGPVTFYVADDAVKAIFSKQNATCVMAAPTWKVTMEDSVHKNEFDSSIATWASKGFHIADKTYGGQEAARRTVAWQGKPALEVVYKIKDSDPLQEQYEMLYAESPGRSIAVKTEEETYVKPFKMSSHVQSFFQGIYNHPVPDSLVVDHTRVYTNGRRDNLVHTLAITKVTVDSSEFSYPKGYKQVSSVKMVMNYVNRKKDAVGVFEDLLGVDTKSH